MGYRKEEVNGHAEFKKVGEQRRELWMELEEEGMEVLRGLSYMSLGDRNNGVSKYKQKRGNIRRCVGRVCERGMTGEGKGNIKV